MADFNGILKEAIDGGGSLGSPMRKATSLAAKEAIESVPEDNKDDDCLDNDNGQFVPKAITSKAKELKKTSKSSYDDFDKIVIDVSNIFAEQKKLNKTIKELKNSIDAKTITAIKEMPDSEIKSMLFHKWIEPLIDNINSLPDSVLEGFISKIKSYPQNTLTLYQA